jgi:hypothetical protein
VGSGVGLEHGHQHCTVTGLDKRVLAQHAQVVLLEKATTEGMDERCALTSPSDHIAYPLEAI